jgi:membrane protease YdiL (CAAX protease family)
MDDETAAKFVLLDFEFVALIAMVSGVLVYALVRRLRRDPLAEGGRREPDYDGFDLLLALFPAMLFLINPIAEAVVAEKPDAKPDAAAAATPDVLSLLMNLGYFTFVGVMTYGLVEWVRNRRVADLFGLRRLPAANIIVISIVAGIFSLLLCGWIVGDFASHWLEGLFGDLDLQEPVKMLRDSGSTLHLVLSIAMACIAAPVVEEFLFRGYLYGTLRQLTHPVFASVIVGALFAVVHGNLPALLPLWVFSILLSVAYEITRCLWVPVGMHVFFNAANIVLMLTPAPGES